MRVWESDSLINSSFLIGDCENGCSSHSNTSFLSLWLNVLRFRVEGRAFSVWCIGFQGGLLSHSNISFPCLAAKGTPHRVRRKEISNVVSNCGQRDAKPRQKNRKKAMLWATTRMYHDSRRRTTLQCGSPFQNGNDDHRQNGNDDHRSQGRASPHVISASRAKSQSPKP